MVAINFINTYGTEITVETDHKPLLILYKKELFDVCYTYNPMIESNFSNQADTFLLQTHYQMLIIVCCAVLCGAGALSVSALTNLEKPTCQLVWFGSQSQKLAKIQDVTMQVTLSKGMKYCQNG